MSNNTLPEEVRKEIQRKAEQYSIVEWGDPAKFPIGDAMHVRRGNSKEDYIAGATEYATKMQYLQQKYDNILDTESGFQNQTENVWQSGYAAGHDSGHEKAMRTLQAKADRMEKALRDTKSYLQGLQAGGGFIFTSINGAIKEIDEALKEGGQDE